MYDSLETQLELISREGLQNWLQSRPAALPSVRALLVVLALCAQPAFAETLAGKVVAITDGDTLTILDANRRQHKVRIAGIDAPERRQPFSEQSRQHLGRIAFERPAILECYKWSYKRRVCNVFVDDKDVGLELVRAGLAWHYKRFEHEQTAEARVEYSKAEVAARSAKVGLWRDGSPIPPWDWRAREKKAK